MWTPWEPVPANIEGDHVAAVVWRQRLHLFWVTFLPKPDTPQPAPDETSEDRAGANIADTMPNTEVEIQLNWCEYFQGKWTARESGGLDAVVRATVIGDFDKSKESRIFIHVTKEYDSDGEESAVVIHLYGENLFYLRAGSGSGSGLDGWTYEFSYYESPETAFRVVSKNSQPEIVFRKKSREIPYAVKRLEATRYRAGRALQLTFEEKGLAVAGEPVYVTLPTQDILEKGDRSYSLLLCSNLSDNSFSEAERILSPFFYQDNLNTFFVDPILFDPPPDEFGIPGITPGIYKKEADSFWETFPVYRAEADEPPRPPESWEPALIDPNSRYSFVARSDWATDPSTAVTFDGFLIGSSGAMFVTESIAGHATTRGSVVAIRDLNVVGGNGVNSAIIADLRGRYRRSENQ